MGVFVGTGLRPVRQDGQVGDLSPRKRLLRQRQRQFHLLAAADHRHRHLVAGLAGRHPVGRAGRSRAGSPSSRRSDTITSPTWKPAFFAAACGPYWPTCFTRNAIASSRRGRSAVFQQQPAGRHPPQPPRTRPPRDVVRPPPARRQRQRQLRPACRRGARRPSACPPSPASGAAPTARRRSTAAAGRSSVAIASPGLEARPSRPASPASPSSTVARSFGSRIRPSAFGCGYGNSSSSGHRLLLRAGTGPCWASPIWWQWMQLCTTFPVVVERRPCTCPLSVGYFSGVGNSGAGPRLPASDVLVLRVVGVQVEGPLQGLRQPVDGHVADPVGAVRAGAEPAVDRAVGVQQEDRERLVGVELEQRQVEAVRGHDADADELLQQRPEDRVGVDQVVVELDALLARDAAQDDDDRLAGLLRLGERPSGRSL